MAVYSFHLIFQKTMQSNKLLQAPRHALADGSTRYSLTSPPLIKPPLPPRGSSSPSHLTQFLPSYSRLLKPAHPHCHILRNCHISPKKEKVPHPFSPVPPPPPPRFQLSISSPTLSILAQRQSHSPSVKTKQPSLPTRPPLALSPSFHSLSPTYNSPQSTKPHKPQSPNTPTQNTQNTIGCTPSRPVYASTTHPNRTDSTRASARNRQDRRACEGYAEACEIAHTGRGLRDLRGRRWGESL